MPTKREQGERWTCTCGAKVVGAQHPDTGNVAPITVAPQDNGNVLLYRDRAVLTWRPVNNREALEWLRAAKVPLRLNHFADCPDVERYR